jgi:hypothetical protein
MPASKFAATFNTEKCCQDLARRIKFLGRRSYLENFPGRLLNRQRLGQLLRKARGATADLKDESSEGHGVQHPSNDQQSCVSG